jgi:hypothetical protein
MFVGNGRAGKSTRLNQLLRHKLRCESPFQTFSGPDPVTMAFQYVGPIKFRELAEIHDIELQVASGPDLFLIDCEGLHALGDTTAMLKQATFALSQMASMTVLVMKEQVNQENIESVRSLFVLSHAFSRQLPGFSIGTTIMMRDVGIRYPPGQQLTLNQKNCLRQKTDGEQRAKILKILNDNRVTFSETEFLVLAQPEFEEEYLYWKSIEDFLRFTANVAENRSRVSGQSLLDLFEEAKPSIMQVTDFSNPSIPFDRIMQNITDRYLNEASSTAIEDREQDVKKWLTERNRESLRRGLGVDFVECMIVKCIHAFEEKSEQLFPHLLEYSPDQVQEHRTLIKNSIETMINELFVEQCIDVLLPVIECEIVHTIQQKIATEMNAIPVANLGNFPFATLSFRHEQEAESRFQQSVLKIHRDIPKSTGFPKLVGEMRRNISEYVKDIETANRDQYAKYVEDKIEREKAAREAKFKEDRAKMETEEAKKRWKLREERDVAERQRKENESRYEMERQKNQALLEEQSAQKKQHTAQMRKIKEQWENQQEILIQRMMDERRQSNARLEAQRIEDQRVSDEKQAQLQIQIDQLKAQPPVTIIKKGGGGCCNVC